MAVKITEDVFGRRKERLHACMRMGTAANRQDVMHGAVGVCMRRKQ
jgi:hypothetical protein